MPLNNPTSGVDWATSTYTGNASGAQRQITTGFVPKMVLIMSHDAADIDIGITARNRCFAHDSSVPDGMLGAGSTTCQIHATDGFNVGGDANNYLNENTKSYQYLAFG